MKSGSHQLSAVSCQRQGNYQPSKLNAESRVRKNGVRPSGSWLLAPDSCRSRGFTLVEVLTVIVIITLLAGIVVGASKYALTKAARSRTQAEIAAMEGALEAFKNDHGSYPLRPTTSLGDLYSSTNIYNALAGGSAVYGPKVYMSFRPNQLGIVNVAGNEVTNVVDAFGVNYRYLSPGTNNATGFDLWSYGPDNTNGFFNGVDHDADNITNWKQ